MQPLRLLGAPRAHCKIAAVLTSIVMILYLQLGFHMGNDESLSQIIVFQVESHSSQIKPFSKTRPPHETNRKETKDNNKTEIKEIKTGPRWTKEIPIIEAKNQPERLRKLPFPHCYKYTCEKPSHFPELRLDEVRVVPSARNVTPSRSSLVFYNRVSKCGSSTTNMVIEKLARLNSFKRNSSEIFLKQGLSWKDQEELASSLNLRLQSNNSLVFDRHVYFINFTRYGLESPIWINIIREPVDRFISLFYYHRQFDLWSPSGALYEFYARPPTWWFEKDLDDCVHKDDPECVLKPGGIRETTITYFCGHHPACMEVGNIGALQRAKRHVETAYSAVGVLEDLPTSMKVLEHYVPRFFRGMSKIAAPGTLLHENKGIARRNVSEETKQILRSMMPLDIEFYDFVKQRLHLQSQKLLN